MPVWAALRDDLILHPGPKTRSGAPTWTLHDPIRNRFFKIERRTFEILSHWNVDGLEDTVEGVQAGSGLRVTKEDVSEVALFVRKHCLVQTRSSESTQFLNALASTRKSGWAKTALKNYLFIRIPVVRPDAFLAATYPLVSWLYAPWVRVIITILGLTGAFLVMRQWDVFTTTMTDMLSLEGLVWFGLTLVAVKILHELGHAYTAHRYGCRVASLGLAFLVMWPVLYTDVTDAWKLPSRRARMAIGMAGMVVEIAIAILATFLWSFLPDGALRSAMFMVATTTWIGTLAVNLLPVLKFDGYFLLSDWLGQENLFERSFTFGRWWLREVFFGWKDHPPETVPKNLQRFMVVFALVVWVYRFFLFLGIAVLVYYFSFKLLGIFLFVIEIWWFILRPVLAEVASWWKRRGDMRLNMRSFAIVSLLVAGLGLFFIPWRSSIEVPAVLTGASHIVLFAPVAGKVEAVTAHMGELVHSGSVLATLKSPALEFQLSQARQELRLLKWEIETSGTSGSFSSRRLIAGEELKSVEQRLKGLNDQQRRLSVISPHAGVVTEPHEDFFVGQWVAKNTPMFKVIDFKVPVVEGYVRESDLRRLKPNAQSIFYPDDPSIAPITLKVDRIEETAVAFLTRKSLASIYGGQIVTRQLPDGKLAPNEVHYKVIFKPTQNNPTSLTNRTLRGITMVSAPSRSLVDRLKTHVLGVIIRESGF